MQEGELRVGFIGFGEAGSAIAAGLKEAGVNTVLAYDLAWQDPARARALEVQAQKTGVGLVRSPAQLCETCQIIYSLVVAGAAVSATQTFIPFLRPGMIYADANSVSPKTKEVIAEMVVTTGARMADVAIVDAVGASQHLVPMLASGPAAQLLANRMRPWGMQMKVLSDRPGEAAAVKMIRSVFMKGAEALILETLLAAQAYNVQDQVLESLRVTFAKRSFPELVDILICSTGLHVIRKAEEMKNVVETLREADTLHSLSQAVSERFSQLAELDLQDIVGKSGAVSSEEVLNAVWTKRSVLVERGAS